MYPRLDYHIHPGYSIDAEDVSIADYCRHALYLGLQEICFTPHLEVDPVRREKDWFVRLKGKLYPMDDPAWLDHYFREIEEVRRQLYRKLTVKAGLEVGYQPGCEKSIERVLRAYPFDFVLGSIHCLQHQSISSWQEGRNYFSSHTMEEVCRNYFSTLLEAVRTNLFDCIAHVDLYRRHGELFWGAAAARAHEGYIEPVLEEMARRNIGLEVNTSSLRRGLGDFHPGEGILKLARKYGVKIFTVGSDAHRLEDLGTFTGEAARKLKEMGLTLHSFTARVPRPL